MSSSSHDPLWPRFWSDVHEADRAPLRDVLAELLGRGVLLGSEGSGRDLFLLARDHYRTHLEDYLAPLALELIVDEEHSILQARPRTESCLLLRQFTKFDSLVVLTLWRLFDDERAVGTQQAIIKTANEVWLALQLHFPGLIEPSEARLKDALDLFHKHRLIKRKMPEGMTQLGDMEIEILPSLARAIPFDDLAAWQTRVDQFQPQDDA
ncbi:MAG: DUF4194 domain-containing protein [Verrucomicrobiaceae bacterium]|nr:DUF4194 domain-containing protein [Verrucomicrobiaceae bacterium]